jgi:hypothetical protein
LKVVRYARAAKESLIGWTEVSQKMQAQGLKIEFGDCKDNGRTRRCVAVQPGTQRWGTEQAPFYVLKGY